MSDTIGINYEGGKMITHILKYPECVGYANCQIVMDAPYNNRVADLDIRSLGRAETLFKEYDAHLLEEKLFAILSYINDNFPDTKIVIQIARGRSAMSMQKDIIDPILDKLSIKNYEFKYGYKAADYYVPSSSEKFVFVLIGMFAILTNVESTAVGDVCNVAKSYNLSSYDSINGFECDFFPFVFTDEKNILLKITTIKNILLLSLYDDMQFLTPDAYPKKFIYDLIDKIHK